MGYLVMGWVMKIDCLTNYIIMFCVKPVSRTDEIIELFYVQHDRTFACVRKSIRKRQLRKIKRESMIK